MYIYAILFLYCSAALLHHGSARSVITSVLVRQLIEADDVNVSPNADHQEPVVVKVGLTITGIQHENPESEFVKVHGFLKLEWRNNRLTWDPLEYNNITLARLPSDHVWLPDITLYNNFDARSRVFAEEKKLVIVGSDGYVIWVPPVTLPLSCNTTEKASGEKGGRSKNGNLSCSMKFGSWTYDESLVDVKPDNEKIDETIQSSRYRITESEVTRIAAVYPCCKEIYPSIQMTFKAERV